MEPVTKPATELTEQELEALLTKKREEKKKALAEEKKKYQQDKDALLKKTAETFLELQDIMRGLKAETIRDSNELYERMYKIEGKDPKENKSFTLKDSADSIKVTVERQERFEFNDEAIVHINAIKDIFKEKFAKRNQGLYEILDGLLIKGSNGEYDPQLLAKARNQVRKLGDEALINEFDKLDDCQKVTGSALYCRLHVRNANKRWEDVSLQFSSL
jgi:hypothetical protein